MFLFVRFSCWVGLFVCSSSRYASLFPPWQELADEVQMMSALLPKLNSPVVYCHNDTTAGNIIFQDVSGSDVQPSLVFFLGGCQS